MSDARLAQKKSKSTVFRKFVLMPLILLYMGTLLLAGWQREVRPAWLNSEYRFAVQLLESVGIVAGMPVFAGSPERMTELIVGRCPLVTAIDVRGRRRRVYPMEPCPRKGHLFTPVVYDHMIVHWVARLQNGGDIANLAALGDHFCQQANDWVGAASYSRIDRVLLELEKTMMDYRTGELSKDLYLLGEVPCRS
ncbi:MAG: hypothetical protein VCB25_01765 [Myxococcota bacterium]